MAKKPDPNETLYISVVTYNSGEFEVILQNGERREVTLTGKQKLTDQEFALLNTWAPACVYTKYKRETPLD